MAVTFVNYSVATSGVIHMPAHSPGDLLMIYSKATAGIINVVGWNNIQYKGTTNEGYNFAWVYDTIGNMGDISNVGNAVLVIYSGCKIGNVNYSQAPSNSPISSLPGPTLNLISPPSYILYFASTIQGLISGISGDSTDIYHQASLDPGDMLIKQSNSTVQVSPPVTVSYASSDSTRGSINAFNISVELIGSTGPSPSPSPVPPNTSSTAADCSGSIKIVAGTTISAYSLENARDLINEIGSDLSDPTADEYESYIANGNNTAGIKGIQSPLPTQSSLPTPSPVPAEESNNSVPPVISTSGYNCIIWAGTDYDIQVSPNFILRNFTIGYSDKSQNAIKGCYFPHELIDVFDIAKQTRFCNIQGLANRVLEPVRAKFGQFRINSGIRNENSVKNGLSQHVTGEAADIQFLGWTYDMYWQNAQWIKDNIPYDQFIFEHSEKTGSVWYHLSFKQSGNRLVTNPTKVMTMYKGHYDSGLKKYY